MENEVKIAICIPSYNSEKTIIRTIDSILIQKRKADLIVLYDDASTDNTESVVKAKFGDAVKYIKGDKNLGIGGARKNLVDEVVNNHPEITHISFLSADDYYLPNFIDDMTVLAERFQHTIFFSGYQIVDSNNNIIGNIVPQSFEHYIDFQIHCLEIAEMNKMIVNYSACIFPLEVFNYVNFNPDLRQSEDLDHFLRTMMLFEFKPITAPLLRIQADNNVSSRTFHRIPEINKPIIMSFLNDLDKIRNTVM